VKDEYDFSKAERGKFFRAGARIRLPVYFDDHVLKDLQERATARGISISELVDELLKKSA
jgi:allophanate hydrolase subunit 1